MPARYALLFPGQASQKLGMGRAATEGFASAARVFGVAEEVSGLPIRRLCFEGPAEELVLTEFLQPCLAATSLAALAAALEQAGVQDPNAPVALARVPSPPSALAGHSVGELSALAASGSLGLEAVFEIVTARAKAMAEAGCATPGGMLALVGGDLEAARALCADIDAETPQFRVGVANLNAPGQTVIAGDLKALEQAAARAGDCGFRRAIRLPVSAAFHTPFMEPVRERLIHLVADLAVHDPRVPVISNVSARVLGDAAAVRAEIASQVTAPVRWADSMRFLSAEGITSFFEVGPGNVLAGLLRRNIRSARAAPAGEPEQLSVLAAKLNGTSDG